MFRFRLQPTPYTIVTFGMLSGQRSTLGNGLSGELRVESIDSHARRCKDQISIINFQKGSLPAQPKPRHIYSPLVPVDLSMIGPPSWKDITCAARSRNVRPMSLGRRSNNMSHRILRTCCSSLRTAKTSKRPSSAFGLPVSYECPQVVI